jgi:DNA-binding CsgD family transcriptional regulator
MTRVAYFTEDEIAKARQTRDQAKTAMELRQALSVLLVAEGGLDADKTSELLGISERTVFRNRRNISNQDGRKKNTWGGRRRYTMTIEDESEFLRDWEVRAVEGGVISVPPIHAALVEKLGRSIPISTTYRLLARHGWRKVQPDTKHPKSDREVQEEYKKNSLKLWRSPA